MPNRAKFGDMTMRVELLLQSERRLLFRPSTCPANRHRYNRTAGLVALWDLLGHTGYVGAPEGI